MRCTENLRARQRSRRIRVRRSIDWTIKRKHRLFDDCVVPRLVKIIVGSKTEIRVLLLRRRIHPSTIVATKRPLFVVIRDDVLTKFRTNCFKQISQVPDDGKVSEDCVLPLHKVVDREQNEKHNNNGEYYEPH